MDTTAAAELGGAAALGGATYWAMDHHRQNYDDDEPDVNDGPLPWTPPDHRRRFSGGGGGGGEPPLKRSKQNQPYDPFEPSSNGNQAVASSRSASAEYGQGSSSGTPPPQEPAASASSSGDAAAAAAKSNRVAIGRMFFKTKLCCKFRTGTCPYVTNCNFAHGMEELRKPPPNWQEIVAQQQEEDRDRGALRSDRDRDRDRDRERRINGHGSGAMGGSAAVVVAGGSGNGNGEASSQRFHKTRSCKKYYTEEGCPYGDRCNFLHDDQGRSRESVAINLGPTAINGCGGGNEILNTSSGNNNSNNGGVNSNNGPSQRPMYWKTRICNKWETTGHCPFGDKCHFAHGVAELQKYGGGLLDSENGAASGGLRNDLKQSASSLKPHTDPIGATYSVFGTDNYNLGVLNQRSISNFQGQRQGQRSFAKWKGPDKISQIYGDWIEDNEWEYTNLLHVSQHEEVYQIQEEETYDAQIKKVEKWQNGSQGQTNIQFGKGGGELQNNRNNLSRDGGKGEDMTSSGGNLDQVYQDDALVGEL